MTISRRSNPKTSRKPRSGPGAGHVKMSAPRMFNAKAFTGPAAGSSSLLPRLLEEFDRNGLCWKMWQVSSTLTEERPLTQLSTKSKRSGIWGCGLRVTLSARACLTTAKEYSLSDLINHRFPITSILTAANCLGILRREKRAGRALDPAFKESLRQTLRLWFNVAAALGTPRQKACAPRYAPKLESIKEATLTDQYYVARNLTWDECEKLMGFPEGWTVNEGDSLVTQ